MKGNKYGARKTVVAGITFHSAAEARRYGELKLLERAGEITCLRLQPAFPCLVGEPPVPVCTYKADFTYRDKAQNAVVEDVKGFATPEYKLKKKLVEALYGITITEVRA